MQAFLKQFCAFDVASAIQDDLLPISKLVGETEIECK